MFWYELLLVVVAVVVVAVVVVVVPAAPDAPSPLPSEVSAGTRGGGIGSPSALGSNGSDGAVGFCDSAEGGIALRCCCCSCCCWTCSWLGAYPDPYRSYTGLAEL